MLSSILTVWGWIDTLNACLLVAFFMPEIFWHLFTSLEIIIIITKKHCLSYTDVHWNTTCAWWAEGPAWKCPSTDMSSIDGSCQMAQRSKTTSVHKTLLYYLYYYHFTKYINTFRNRNSRTDNMRHFCVFWHVPFPELFFSNAVVRLLFHYFHNDTEQHDCCSVPVTGYRKIHCTVAIWWGLEKHPGSD